MWWIPLIASLLAAGGSLAGTLISNKKTREYNRELAEYQNQENLAQWARENDYNTPLAQMQRFQNAGLNPNLIYGQQNLSADSPMLTSGQPGSPVDFAPFGQMGADAAQRSIENSVAMSQKDLLDSQAAYYRSQTEGQDIHNESAGLQLKLDYATFGDKAQLVKKQVSFFDSQMQEISARINNLNAQTILTNIQNRWQDKILSKQLDKIGEEIKQLTAETHYKDMLSKLTNQQIGRMITLLPFEQANLEADTKLKVAQALKTDQETTLAFNQAALSAFELQYQQDNRFFLDYLKVLPDFSKIRLGYPGESNSSFRSDYSELHNKYYPVGIGYPSR